MRRTIAVYFVCTVLIAGLAAGGTKSTIDTPALACAGGTQVSRSVTICAPATGSTGLPAGFSLQWMTCDELAANGGQWYSSDDPRLHKASFSGNANGSRYALAPGQCVTVNVGDFLFDAGMSTNSTDNLSCGTCYAFHAFGHATNKDKRSDFTADLNCSTLACGNGEPQCTFTFNDWLVLLPPCDPGEDMAAGPRALEVPSTLTLGTVTYTMGQVACFLGTPANGNGLLDLAHQLIAAKLNAQKNGSLPAATAACIADADALIGSLQIGTGFLDPSATSTLASCLASYNDGAVGPGACAPPDPGPD